MAEEIKSGEVQITEINLVLSGSHQIKDFTEILNLVLKGTGLRYCALIAYLQKQMLEGVKKAENDHSAGIHSAKQMDSDR